MAYRYIVEKFAGKVYCGNGFFDTREECIKFGEDGFCDMVKILDTETGKKENCLLLGYASREEV